MLSNVSSLASVLNYTAEKDDQGGFPGVLVFLLFPVLHQISLNPYLIRNVPLGKN